MSELRIVPPTGPRVRAHYLVRGTIAPHFVEAGALSAKDAIAFSPPDPRQVKELAAMVADGSIRTLGNGRFWFDMDAYEAATDARRRRNLPILILAALIVAAVAVLFYRG